MATSKLNVKDATKAGALTRTASDALPEGTVEGKKLPARFKHRYTTGPFSLPENSGSLDWILLNNDPAAQTARVTVFRCPLGAPKVPEPPGPLVVNLAPGASTHNANEYTEGFIYEVQVECNSQLVFPYASVWPKNFGVVIPGTGINSGTWLRLMS